MAKMQIRRIGVLSFAKVYAVVLTGIALIIAIPLGLITMIFGAAMLSQQGGAAAGVGVGLGLLYMIMLPVMYGIIGFIFGALTALIYNVAAGFVGGIELEMEEVGTEYSAPPPPPQPWTEPPNPYQSNQPF